MYGTARGGENSCTCIGAAVRGSNAKVISPVTCRSSVKYLMNPRPRWRRFYRRYPRGSASPPSVLFFFFLSRHFPYPATSPIPDLRLKAVRLRGYQAGRRGARESKGGRGIRKERVLERWRAQKARKSQSREDERKACCRVLSLSSLPKFSGEWNGERSGFCSIFVLTTRAELNRNWPAATANEKCQIDRDQNAARHSFVHVTFN